MKYLEYLEKLLQKENLLARVGAVLIACGLWVYVMTEQNPIVERSYDVRLRQTHLPEAMMVFNAPERVTVKVRGSRSVLNDNSGEAIAASIDLANITAGQRSVPVTASFGRGDVVSVSPDLVSVYIDTVSEKEVPVITRLIGAFSDDMTVGSSVITPSYVVVKGATHSLDRVNKVVAPIDVTGHNANFSMESEMVAVSDDGYDIPDMQITPERVMVDASMVRQMLSVDLPVEGALNGTLPDGIKVSKIEVVPPRIRLTAPPSVLKGLAVVKTKPVDISRLRGSAVIAAELDLPDKAIPGTRTVQLRFSIERDNH